MAQDLLSLAVGNAQELLPVSESVLELSDFTGAILRALRLRKHQLGATGSLLTGSFFPLTIASRSFAVTEEGFSGAVYAQRLVDPLSDNWNPVEIADISNMDELEDEGTYAIAFYGSPNWQARVSWEPGLEQYNDIRIWHDPQAIEPMTMDTDLGVVIKIVPLILAHDAVLELLPRCRLKDKENWDAQTIQVFQQTSMAARAELLEQFDIWRFESEDDTGLSQSARFDSQRRGGGRRSPVFRA